MIWINSTRTFAAVLCLFSLLGIYMVRTVCMAEDLLLTDLDFGITENHNGEHHHHHSKDADHCCSDLTAQYFSTLQATTPNTPTHDHTIPFKPLVTTFQILRKYNKPNSSPETILEKPPSPTHSGAIKRIIMQSFQC